MLGELEFFKFPIKFLPDLNDFLDEEYSVY